MKTDIRYKIEGDVVTRQIAVAWSEGNLSKPLPRRRRRFRAFRVEKEYTGGSGTEAMRCVAVSGEGSPCGADAEDAETRFAGRGKGWEEDPSDAPTASVRVRRARPAYSRQIGESTVA